MLMRLNGRYGRFLEYILIFVIVAIAYALIAFTVPWFAANDDAHIHTIRAASYIWNIDVPYPITNVLGRAGIGFYQLYYVLHVPFLAIASVMMRGGLLLHEAPSLSVLYVGAKLFHICLIATFYVTVFAVTKHMFGRMAAYISLALVVTTSQTFFLRFVLFRPHTLASLLFLLFVMGVIWRKYWLIFIAAAATVLSYTVAFMLIIPAALVCWIERNVLVLAVALGGLIAGVLVHPFGISYVEYAWLAHIVSAGLAAMGLHPAMPSEFATKENVIFNGVWLLVIFFGVVLSVMRPKTAQKFLMQREAAELAVVTIIFIPLLILSSRGGEYFVPLFCVLAAGFLSKLISTPDSEEANQESVTDRRKIRLISWIMAIMVAIFATQNSVLMYQAFAFSADPYPSFRAAQCIGEGRVHSRDFGDYVYFTFANQKLHFTTGIDPIFTVFDPEYGKYASDLFDHTKSLAETLPTLRALNVQYIETSAEARVWPNGLTELLKSEELQPVCLTPGSTHLFFKILPAQQ